MKTVFILGAGASHEAGAPLMVNFLDKAEDLLRRKIGGAWKAKEDFERIFEAVAELRTVHAKSYLDLRNVEILFGAIEMALTIGKFGSRNCDEIKLLRESLMTVVYKTLECSIRFPANDDRFVISPVPYGQFMQLLKSVTNELRSQDLPEYAFITFNYDVCLDYALGEIGFAYDYGLHSDTKADRVSLLKLHGSINWTEAEDGRVVAHPLPRPGMVHPGGKFATYDIGSLLVNSKNSEKQKLVLVPPTWNKTMYHGQLAQVWSIAARELAAAENIIVVGYSLPETDSFFRYLFALGTDSDSTIRNLVVINPDTSGETEKRFRDLVGRGIERRFNYIPKTFSGAMADIGAVLRNP